MLSVGGLDHVERREVNPHIVLQVKPGDVHKVPARSCVELRHGREDLGAVQGKR